MRNYNGDIISTDANNNFMNEEAFIKAYEEVKKTDTKGYLGNYDIRWRIHTILWAAEHCSKLDGDFVDCGGGFGFFMSSIYSYLNFENLNKKYYMLDSFEGTNPVYGPNHFTRFGSWYGDVLSNHGNKKNLQIIKGFIPETLNQINCDKISFLSIDLNSVNPEISCLEILWDKIVTNGLIIFDDYGFPGCNEQREAHNNFAKNKNLSIMSSPTGQGILIKI